MWEIFIINSDLKSRALKASARFCLLLDSTSRELNDMMIKKEKNT